MIADSFPNSSLYTLIRRETVFFFRLKLPNVICPAHLVMELDPESIDWRTRIGAGGAEIKVYDVINLEKSV